MYSTSTPTASCKVTYQCVLWAIVVVLLKLLNCFDDHFEYGQK